MHQLSDMELLPLFSIGLRRVKRLLAKNENVQKGTTLEICCSKYREYSAKQTEDGLRASCYVPQMNQEWYFGADGRARQQIGGYVVSSGMGCVDLWLCGLQTATLHRPTLLYH